jgi:hypothetical protein
MSRNIKLLLFAVLFANFQIFKFSNCQAQVPQKFNYQGIARDAKGNPLSQQRMTLKLTVLPTSDATEGEYEEIQTVTTNEFGLYTLQIGNGSPLKGEMSAVKWETGNKYIKVAIDPKGGSDFLDAGTNQLLSVPYAIYADKAGVAKNSGSTSRATNNFIEKTNGSGVVNSTSQIYDNGTNIGIGTTSPVARVHVATATAGVQEHIRMQNTSTTGAGRFTLYNSNSSAYATFTKYGTNYAGGYTGISSLYPYANLLAFGNNDTNGAGNGRFLISTEGNTGISIFKSGTSKLKLHIDYATERVGIGGNSIPASNVHLNNTDGIGDTLKLTNNTSGHTSNDGLDISIGGNVASIVNKENAALILGTNNTEQARITGSGDIGIGTTSPQAKLHIISQNLDTAFFATTNDPTSLNQVGVMGAYNTSGYGAGVVGRGFNGTMPPSTRDIGVYGSSSDVAVWSNGPILISDGTQANGKVLTSDANGKGSWKNGIYSSPWMNSSSANSSDTTIDGTCVRARYLSAPEITAAVLNGAMIVTYFRVGSIGPYQLPYTSDAGGATNSIACGYSTGKIVIYRHTFNTCRFNSGIPEAYPGQPVLVNLPQSLEYRYVIYYNE